MNHALIKRAFLLLLTFGALSTARLSAQVFYFSEPFNVMLNVGPPTDSLVAPLGWESERVTTVPSAIVTPPRVTHRTSPTSPSARINGNGARDFEIATRVSTGEWVVTVRVQITTMLMTPCKRTVLNRHLPLRPLVQPHFGLMTGLLPGA